jgi:uncharacterized protein YbaR (Trm112 family)
MVGMQQLLGRAGRRDTGRELRSAARSATVRRCPLDKNLLDILVCPICKGKLVYPAGRQELICKGCRLAYPIRDGIPVMLEDEARALPADEEVVD